MGRPGRVPGTRELVVPRTPSIVPYRGQRATIQILRVFRGARRWPERVGAPADPQNFDDRRARAALSDCANQKSARRLESILQVDP
jgi:hypothetical protein